MKRIKPTAPYLVTASRRSIVAAGTTLTCGQNADVQQIIVDPLRLLVSESFKRRWQPALMTEGKPDMTSNMQLSITPATRKHSAAIISTRATAEIGDYVPHGNPDDDSMGDSINTLRARGLACDTGDGYRVESIED